MIVNWYKDGLGYREIEVGYYINNQQIRFAYFPGMYSAQFFIDKMKSLGRLHSVKQHSLYV
jgi:hypothetical protein